MKQRAVAQCAVRRLSVVAVLFGGAVACSLVAPSFDEYANPQPAGGRGGASGDAALAGVGASAGVGGTSPLANGGGTAGQIDAEAGAGGALEELPDVPGVLADASEISFRQVVYIGVPRFALLTSYAGVETLATTANRPAPIYTPYDANRDAWWDNLVAEQLQARARYVLFTDRGAYQTASSDLTGPAGGAENPRHLASWMAALTRAKATDQFIAACRLEPSSLRDVAFTFHAQPNTTLLDLSSQSDWNDVFWLRAVKPFFDTLPSKYWDQDPTIDFASISSSIASNVQGNASKLVAFLVTQFQTAYGKTPHIYLDASWAKLDTTLTDSDNLSANCPGYSVPSTPSAFTSACGTALPGYADPSYFDATSANYQKSSVVIPRTKVDAYANTVFTLETGLASAYQAGSPFTILSSYTDINTASGSYRSLSWGHPDQYLNLVRRYADMPTKTLLLQAENGDEYYDTTSGNSGAAFARSGDLDIRALSGSGWAVTNTAPGEWIQFDDLDFSTGNYEVFAQYSTGGASTGQRIALQLDRERLAPVVVPETVNVDTFALTSLGRLFIAHGTHTLRARFLDGAVDLDWLFVKKLDPTFALKDMSGHFVSASAAGGRDVNSGANAAAIFEELTFDDLNGGELVNGDQVSIQTFNGYYVSSSAGAINATARKPTKSEVFTVKLVSGSSVAVGSSIALLASDGTHYWTANDGPNDASGTTIGAPQTFVLVNDTQ